MSLALARAGALATAARRRALGGGAPPYTLADDPLTRLWWDPTTVSGAVPSWADLIAGVTAVQATGTKQPTAGAVLLGGFPGVASDGGDELVAMSAGVELAGATGLTLTFSAVDSVVGTTAVPIEFTPNAGTTNGSAGVYVDTSNRLHATCRAATALTDRHAPEALATVKVVSIGYSFSTAGAGAVAFVRVNGVAQTLTNMSTGSTAGVAANSGLYLFARGGSLMLPWAGVLGDVTWRESIAQDAALAAAEAFIASRCGVTL